MSNKDNHQAIQNSDESLIDELRDESPEIPEETAIKAYKAKIQRDLEVNRKLQNARYMVAEKQLKELSQLELSKTSDFFMVEYGFSLDDLLHTVKVLKIEEI